MKDEFIYTTDLTHEERAEIASGTSNAQDAVQAVADALLAKIIKEKQESEVNDASVD